MKAKTLKFNKRKINIEKSTLVLILLVLFVLFAPQIQSFIGKATGSSSDYLTVTIEYVDDIDLEDAGQGMSSVEKAIYIHAPGDNRFDLGSDKKTSEIWVAMLDSVNEVGVKEAGVFYRDIESIPDIVFLEKGIAFNYIINYKGIAFKLKISKVESTAGESSYIRVGTIGDYESFDSYFYLVNDKVNCLGKICGVAEPIELTWKEVKKEKIEIGANTEDFVMKNDIIIKTPATNGLADRVVLQIPSEYVITPVCGNNIKESGEECDSSDLTGQTCKSLGYDGGLLACATTDCKFDYSNCVTLKTLEPNEYHLNVNSPMSLFGKQISLLNVGSGGSIIVDVDGTIETIQVESTMLELSITNIQPIWDELKVDRSAVLKIIESTTIPICTDTTWTPDSATVCSGETFTQTSNCGTIKTETGTKTCPQGQICQSGTCITETTSATDNGYTLNKGDSVTVAGKTVTLLNIGSSGAVMVGVDGITAAIILEETKVINELYIKMIQSSYSESYAIFQISDQPLAGELGPLFQTINDIIIIREGTHREFLTPPMGSIDRWIMTEPNTNNFLQKIYENYPDKYDFIAVFPTVEIGGAFSNTINSDINGIGPIQGIPGIFTTSSSYTTKLKSLLKIDFYRFYQTHPEVEDNFLHTLVHELGHHWCCYINLTTSSDRMHWPNNLDLFYGDTNYVDSMGYYQWVIDSSGNEVCVWTGQSGINRKFSDLSLYLMGLKPANEVAPIKVHDFEPKPGNDIYNMWGPSCGEEHTFTGTREMTIQQIINLNGQRIPDYTNTQKDFNIVFVVLLPKDQEINNEFIDYVNKFKSPLPPAWAEAASYKSTITYEI